MARSADEPDARPSASNDMSDQPSVLVAGPHTAAQTAAPGTSPPARRPRKPLSGCVRRHPLLAVALALTAGAVLGSAVLR